MTDNIRKENYVNEQLLEEAKAKLRWYTMEASDEEFDEEEVDLLVSLIQKLESQPEEQSQETERELARFRAYVEFYQEEEAARAEGKSESVQNEELDKHAKVGKEAAKTFGRILRVPIKGFYMAVAACLVLLLIVGYSFGEVNADDNTGFFHWLKRDKEGVLAVTSPEKSDVEMNDDIRREYDSIEELPEEYHQYVIEKSNISSLKEYHFEKFVSVKSATFDMLTELFVCSKEGSIIRMGVLIYSDKSIVLRDKFNDYEYLYTNDDGERQQEVYKKEEAEKVEYMIIFYRENVKYFVSGNETVDFLQDVSKEYMDLVFD